jgi:protein TonB
MPAHADILDQSESLQKPFLGSIAFHTGLVALFFGYAYTLHTEQWGSPNPSAGGSVAINAVKTIPLPPRTGRRNPLASNTESQVPAAPQKPVAKQKVRPPEPNAIPLKSKTVQKEQTQSSTTRYHPPDIPKQNQVYSSQAPAAVSPMFAKSGAGTVGVDQNSVLGNRFGAYAALLMQRVAERWHTGGLEGVRAPMAIVSVDLYRNGSIRNPKLVQSSGNYQLDTSAQRAVVEAAPFPPLPAEYERDMVNIEFRFQLQR